MSKDAEKDVLIPAISGVKNLVLATKNEPKIKRVVFTSSLAANVDMTEWNAKPDKVFTADDWNNPTYEEAKTSKNMMFAYRSSKAIAEKAFWEYIEKEKPAWHGVSLLPG